MVVSSHSFGQSVRFNIGASENVAAAGEQFENIFKTIQEHEYFQGCTRNFTACCRCRRGVNLLGSCCNPGA
jgi:hypothetical protein